MNDMTDFDKLIKEKTEQASYPYDEAAWRRFKHTAGLRGGSAKYWVVGTATIVTVGAFLLLKQARQGQPTPTQSVPTAVISEDSVLVSQNQLNDISKDTATLHVVSKSGNDQRRKPHQNSETAGNQPSRIINDTLKSSKVIYGKPIVIDVDTITRMVPTDEELKKGHSRLY